MRGCGGSREKGVLGGFSDLGVPSFGNL